jgi:NitT/TauT family transport system substrate-binding protein
MAAQVGIDPSSDIDWITSDRAPMQMFAEGQVDAFLGFPPEPQELRSRNVGRVILKMLEDKPWSQYYCCIAFGNREFVRDHPIATKRYLKALYKAAEMCAGAPKWAAQSLVDAGFTTQYDYALQTLSELPYGRWHEFDPADSMRFYALRLREVGMVTSNPNTILADGTDWRFVNELKRELKT